VVIGNCCSVVVGVVYAGGVWAAVWMASRALTRREVENMVVRTCLLNRDPIARRANLYTYESSAKHYSQSIFGTRSAFALRIHDGSQLHGMVYEACGKGDVEHCTLMRLESREGTIWKRWCSFGYLMVYVWKALRRSFRSMLPSISQSLSWQKWKRRKDLLEARAIRSPGPSEQLHTHQVITATPSSSQSVKLSSHVMRSKPPKKMPTQLAAQAIDCTCPPSRILHTRT
jgi:hypothetical protein